MSLHVQLYSGCWCIFDSCPSLQCVLYYYKQDSNLYNVSAQNGTTSSMCAHYTHFFYIHTYIHTYIQIVLLCVYMYISPAQYSMRNTLPSYQSTHIQQQGTSSGTTTAFALL